MIHDNLEHCNLYSGLNPLFKKAFDYLLKTDFNKLELGKHAIEGDDLFVITMEYDTKEASECLLENHRKYIDIQYILSGEEFIGITTFNNQPAVVPYDETKDIAFYNNAYTSLLKLVQGQFAIFFPHDMHVPCLKTEKATKVRKAVFKIRVME